MIKVENLSKKYGNHYAIKDLSFEIEKGNVYGFLGPNGAGKSTTMNIITGYIAASDGNVKICDNDILKNASKAKKCIGYLPEMPPLYQDMTVKEYLEFSAELKKIAKNERAGQIEKVMEKTFITDMQNRLIKNLSKGYKQRVGLAMAMLGDPEIIILDEPTVGLDPKQIIEIRELIRELKKEHTVILSSHILSEVAEVCDKLIIIAHGRIVASGTIDELMSKHGNGNSIEMIVKAEADAFTKIIKSMENIESFDVKELDDGKIECVIKVAEGKDIIEALNEKILENKLYIYKLVQENMKLEDIFLELTDDKKEEE